MKALITSVALLLLFLFPATSFAAEVFFYDTDNVGTPVAMWNEKGDKAWEGEYYPFGEEFRVSESPAKNDKRLIGKEKDKETGLTYFGARYFDESSGRFITPDPVRPVDSFTSKGNLSLLDNPQRLNRYAYGLNNPYRYVDPDGEFVVSGSIAVGYGAYIGATALAVGIFHYGAPIAADAGKWLHNVIWNEKNTEGTTVIPGPS